MRAAGGRAPAALAAAMFLGLAALRIGAPEVCCRLIRLTGVAPFRFPFLDTDMVLSALRCRARGIDVYASDPCDALGRVYDYSPAWLALGRLGLARAALPAVGAAVDLGFLACLWLLPPVRRRGDAALVALGTVSTASLFALERGNTDLVILSLALCAARLATRSPPLRALGYGFCFLAGLLKYYPMALMLLALREPPRRLLAAAGLAAIGLAAFVAVEHRDLARALALIPTGSWFGDMFGARDLPMGLAALTGPWGGPGWARALEAGLVLAAAAVGLAVAADRGFAVGLAALAPAERAFLLAACALTLACFLTAQNIGYRAIVLVPALPALAALRRPGPGGGAAGALRRAGPWLALAALWSIGWRYWLHEAGRLPFLAPAIGRGLDLAGWLAWQAAWWALVALLAACLAGLVSARLAGWRRAEADGNRTHRSLSASPWF